MPRWRSYMETTTNDYLAVDLSRLKALGMLDKHWPHTLTWSRGDRNIASIGVVPSQHAIVFKYTDGGRNGSEKIDVVESMHLTETACNYGGARKWFVCKSCGNRARILYGGRYFRCRKCYGLAYPSQYEEKRFRYLDYARDIQYKLCGERYDLDLPLPKRPKGMHRTTYKRLEKQYNYYRNFGLMASFKKLSKYRHVFEELGL